MKKLALIVFTGLLFAGCVKNNPDPAWLEVNEWTLLNNGSITEGELEHDFSSAWVYIDGKLIGVFEVPFKIPVLVSGNSTITLYPTIKDNGISATKKIYPFVEPYTINANLVANQTLTIDPTTQYYSECLFRIWDFEDPNTGFTETPLSTTTIFTSNDPAIIQPTNGNQFGRVNLNETENYWQAASTQSYSDIPRGGAEVYLEVTYHNTVSVVTGVLALEPNTVVSNPNVQINGQEPSEAVWKKIYIELKTIVSGSTNANAFQLSYDAFLPDSLSTGQINLDNIKLVHF